MADMVKRGELSSPRFHRARCRGAYASRSRQPVNSGFTFSASGTGKLTSVPYAPPLKKFPDGKPLRAGVLYWRTMRRRSPSRWPRPKVQNDFSRKNVAVAADGAGAVKAVITAGRNVPIV